jgi:hypothetical protein
MIGRQAPAVMAINLDQARHRQQAAIRSPGFESSAARVAVPRRVGSHFHHSLQRNRWLERLAAAAPEAPSRREQKKTPPTNVGGVRSLKSSCSDVIVYGFWFVFCAGFKAWRRPTLPSLER